MTDNTCMRVVELYRAGHTPKQIGAITGLTGREISNALRRAQYRGLITRSRNRSSLPIYYIATQQGLRFGGIGDITDELSPDQRTWLVDEAVRVGCRTLAEFLAEIVRDAHAEAVQPKPQRTGRVPRTSARRANVRD